MKKIAVIMEYFTTSINQINNSNYNEIEKISQKIAISVECLGKFRDILRHNKFLTPNEEIYYFKFQKPIILGKLDYYRIQKEFILEKPIRTISKQKESILNELNRIDNDNVASFEFVKYYRLNQNELDHLFFIRGNEHFEMFLISPHQNHDPEFSTQHDYLVANIITNELLLKFYNKQLQYLNRNDLNIIEDENSDSTPSSIPWTGTPTELIELLLGLNAKGAIGDGNLSIKEIEEICINNYGVYPGNTYQIVEQIKARKSNSTKFIEKLKISLIKWLSEN